MLMHFVGALQYSHIAHYVLLNNTFLFGPAAS